MQKQAVAYCRVSSTKQAQQGESLEEQAIDCQEIAKQKGAIVVPNGNIFQDAFSGRKDHRPAFDAAMAYIKNHPGEVDYFIVRDIDRLTRGGGVVYAQLKAELEKYGVELVDGRGVIQPSLNTLERYNFT